MYGVEFLNAAKSVTISSKDRPLVFAFRGELSVLNSSVVDRPAFGSVNFAAPISTVAAPKVFLRLKSSRHPSMSIYLSVNGSPGNWTGFSIWASAQGGGTLPLYVIEYVIARQSFREPSKAWGMQIMDVVNGGTLFSSDERVVRYAKFTKKWTLQSSVTGAAYYSNWVPDVAIEDDDFIDTSFFNRGAIFQWDYYGMFCVIVLYRGGVRVFNLQTQSYSSIRFDGPGNQLLCTPICKFPLSRYPT